MEQDVSIATEENLHQIIFVVAPIDKVSYICENSG